MLRRKLDKLGIHRVEHNIWDDPAHAEVVRSHANGNETVPTVVVGDVAMVNPSANELVAVLEQHAPHLLPDDLEVDQQSTVGRLLSRVRGG